MPCLDPRDHNSTSSYNPGTQARQGMTINDFEAALCGLFTAIEKWGNDTTPEGRLKMMLNKIDWKETGVKRKSVEKWWKEHKAEDAARHKREDAEKRKAELKTSALSKLSPDEREALGIK